MRILAWGDSPLAATGYGTVTRHILLALHGSGRYEVDQLAVHYDGQPYDPRTIPFRMMAANQAHPQDPLGKQQLLRLLDSGAYDMLWFLGDSYVPHSIVPELRKIKASRRGPAGRSLKTLTYFPVDSNVIYSYLSSFLEFVDAPVTFTRWGRDVVSRIMPGLSAKLRVIYHGCDSRNFHPLDAPARAAARQLFGISDLQSFLIVNVATNVPRKDLPRCILAFAHFKKRVPQSMLYLHTNPFDQVYQLVRCAENLGLSSAEVRFPQLSGGGMPMELLNQIYNAADAFFTTTLGEGWGLPITEAMAAGTPVVAPSNSSIPEILGEDRERGYSYPCREDVWVDEMGFRPLGRMEEIVPKLLECYDQRGSPAQQAMLARAQAFVREYPWERACRQWVDLFDEVVASPHS